MNNIVHILHIPVLKDEVIRSLKLKESGTYVDCTFGSGGHSREIISTISSEGKLISFDCDRDSLARCPSDIKNRANFSFVQDDFSNLSFHLTKMGISLVDGFVFDLGLSSEQIASNRGFSYRREEDFLDMRMNYSALTTASDIVNNLNEEDLANIIFYYGEERFSRRIAKSICNFRKKERITRVCQLTKIVTSSLASKKRRIKHPATKVFQSLRIAVNDELKKLERSILEASSFLSDEASLVVISYHSLEDRIVKRTFKFLCESNDNNFVCSKKPVVPTKEEIEFNNKSRSAKMRVLSKLPKNDFSSKNSFR